MGVLNRSRCHGIIGKRALPGAFQSPGPVLQWLPCAILFFRVMTKCWLSPLYGVHRKEEAQASVDSSLAETKTEFRGLPLPDGGTEG